MSRYAAQFGVEDVFQKYMKLHELGDRSKINALRVFRHDVASFYGVVMAESLNLRNRMPKPSRHRDYFGSLNICCISAARAMRNAEAIMNKTKLDQNELCRESDNMVSWLQGLSWHLPSSEIASEYGPIGRQKYKATMERIDISAARIFYGFNSIFSPHFQKTEYMLCQDIEYYFATDKDSAFHDNKHTPKVIVQADYLVHAIVPLVTNAEQHGYGGSGRVDVTGTVDESRKEVVITVRDYGKGIDPAIRGSLFERGATTNTSDGEHGIGLYSVKQFVEEHGGRIWCDSRPGDGTSFHFAIPYRKKCDDTYVQ